MEEQSQRKPIGYTVRYYPRLLGSESENFVGVNHKRSTRALTKMTVYTMFDIFVSAVSSGGIGPGWLLFNNLRVQRR